MQLNFSGFLMGRSPLALGKARLLLWLVLLMGGATLMTGCTSNVPDAGFINTYAGNGNAEFDGDNKAPADTAFNAPAGMDASGNGDVLIADTGNNRVRNSSFKVDTSTNPTTVGDRVETLAGTGVAGFGGDDGPGVQAQLNGPRAVIVGPDAVIFIADTGNNRVRRLNAGTISTEIGDGVARFAGDGGSATAASLSAPVGLAFDDNNRLFIADSGNNRVRVVAGGDITTFAGNGTAAFAGDGSAASAASLSNPQGVAVDEQNNIYIADTGNNRIRRVTPAGLISTVAGGGSGGDGALATQAALNNPTDVRVTRDGQIIISEGAGNKIRRVTAAGVLTTLAGTGAASFGGDLGPATTARLNNPRGLSLDQNDDVYIADSGNNRIRALGLTGLPGAVTRAATNVTNTTATLNGLLERNDVNASAEFQYGLTTAYGTSVPVAVTPGQNDGDGNSQNLTVNITGLLPDQIYHFRLVVTNSVGTTLGQDVTFSTGDASPSLVVTTLSDQSSDSDNQTTLREAFEFANSDGDASEITFAPGLTGTITLDGESNDGNLNASSSVTLTGPGAQVITVAGGNGSSSIFLVNSNSNFALSGLTLRGLGSARGNDENDDFGIFNRGGNLTVANCVLDGFNQAIRSSLATTISGSTITGSSADNAAINIQTGSLSLTNSTVSGNAGNGISLLDGPATLLNCTISGNGQTGLFNPEEVSNVKVNAIVSPASVNNCLIVGNGTDVDGTIVGNGNITTGTPAEAGLDPDGLQDNGGQTPTIALITVGSAVDGGNNAAAQGLTTDQRGAGFPRVFGSTVDVGAFELSNAAPGAANIALSTNEDATLTFTAAQFDAGFSDGNAGDTLQSVRIDTLPTQGTLAVAGNAATAGQTIARANIGTLIYTPNLNFNGADSFGYSASDGQAFSATGALVNLTVSSVNDAPSFVIGNDQTVAENSGEQTVANFATQISVGPANENAQQPSFVLVSNTNSALFSVAPAIAPNGTLTYTPATNAAGAARVSFAVQDSGGTDRGGVNASAAQSFAITVSASPLFVGVSLSPTGPLTRDVLTATPRISDRTGVTFTYDWFNNNQLVQSGTRNTLNLNTPGFGDKGDRISVSMTASNTRGGLGSASNFAIVRNSAPFAFSGTAGASSGVETLIALRLFGNPGGGDSDGDVLTFKRVGGPKNGTAQFVKNTDGSNALLYQSRAGFIGVEVILFVSVDSEGRSSNIATLAIDVKGLPIVPPIAQDASGVTQPGVQVDVPLTGSDPNGGLVTFKRVGGPVNGTGGLVVLADGTTVMRYTSRRNFAGVEEIRFVALNAAGRPSNVATIRITVGASNASAAQASAAQASGSPSGGSS